MSNLFKNKYNLTVTQLAELSNLYQAHCTAEFILENYDGYTESEAIKIGYAVRELMADNPELTENDAIDMYIASN